ncbi:MAG TPA: hypothetical protein VFF50_12265 [Candidatus Deferrimicrobiaceae bacterium]|nr:hypothetical protein [Candidatus Deferrimicrobiaceae bacterium]
MSANATVVQGTEPIRSSTHESALPAPRSDCAVNGWNPEDFAREQILCLVRRVFFANGDRPARQVVFSAVERNIDVVSICDQVARALAQQTAEHVAVVDVEHRAVEETCIHPSSPGSASIKSRSARIAVNLWRVPKGVTGEFNHGSGTGLHWLRLVEALRNEFEFVVIQGPAAGTWSEAALLGQLTDGIILVLDARRTRRAAARKAKETLDAAQCRMLGTVLTQRTFPIPERIYRHL